MIELLHAHALILRNYYCYLYYKLQIVFLRLLFIMVCQVYIIINLLNLL